MQTRRKFIYSAGVISTAALGFSALKLLGGPSSVATRDDLPDEWVWVGKSNGRNKQELSSTNQEAFLIGVHPASGEKRLIPIRFLAHEISVNPVAHNLAAATMKWGAPAIIADLKAAKVLQPLQAPAGTQFFGHSIWSPDGKQLYCVANNENEQRGEIHVYSTRDFSITNRISLTGKRPHQMRVTEIPGIYAIVNEVSPHGCSNVDFVDVQNGTIIKSWDIPAQSFYHFAYSKEHKRIWAGGFVGTHSNMGPSLFDTVADNKSTPIEIPNFKDQIIKGENLSLSLGMLGDKEVVAFTVSGGQFFAFYDTENNRYSRISHDIAAPRGIDFSKKNPHLVYVSDDTHKMSVYDTRHAQLNLLTTFEFGNGSHLAVVD